MTISRKMAKLGVFPPHSVALCAASLAFLANAPQMSFLEIPKVRNYGIASTQGKGLWPRPRKSANLGASVPHSAALLVASSAFMSDLPQISFLEITKLRERVDSRKGSLAMSPKIGEIRYLPAKLSCVVRGFLGFHSRRVTNYLSRSSEITELRKCVDSR